MEGVKAAEYGLSFVRECFRRYLGESWLIAVIFFAGMAVTAALHLFSRRKDGGGQTEHAVTRMYLAASIVLALTVYNPFFVRKLVPKLGMTTVYYRMFWALPLTSGAAYYIVLYSGKIRKKVMRGAALAGSLLACALVMPICPGIPNLSVPTNLYKVKGAVPVICSAVHSDYEQSEQYGKAASYAQDKDISTKEGAEALAMTLPKCVFPYEIEFQVRQYDPGIRLTVNRNQRLYYEGNTATGISYSTDSPIYARLKAILDAMYGRDESLSRETFQSAMEETYTRYLIVESDRADRDFLTDAGCRLVSQTAGYDIYSYGLTEAGE